MKIFVSTILCLLVIVSGTATADIIYFKDGMRTVCHGKAWEEKNEVKCDYDGVILSYRKEDVEQIHKTIIIEEPTSQQEPDVTPTPDSGAKGESAAPETAVKRSSNMGSSGIAFYDPRRQLKYWSSPSAKHRSYRDAIKALAKEFGQTPQWIEDHIGDTNDLAIIRKNLSNPAKIVSKTVPPAPAGVHSPVHELFYNPRRQYKYQISAKQRFHTYQEAINALAVEFESSPRWVEEHMGQENDILLIRQNLIREKQAQGSVKEENPKDY